MTVKEFNEQVNDLTETQHQFQIIKWSQQPSIRNKFPELALLFHIPNERKCSPAQGNLLKRMGVKSGVPDLCLPVPRGGYHALYIELKADKGRLSDNQKWWINKLSEQNNFCVICYGWEQAVNALTDYLSFEGDDLENRYN